MPRSTTRSRRAKEKTESTGYSAQTITEQLILDPTLQDNIKDLKDEELKARLVDWAKSEYRKMKSSMDQQRSLWYLNHAFYRGRQYNDVVGGKFLPIPDTGKQPRLTVNRIEPVVRTEMARMLAQDPTAEFIPGSSENSDIETAKAAEAVYLHVRRAKKLKDKNRGSAFWTSVCGIGYIKTFWDGTAEVLGADENGREVPVKGEVDYQVVLPFNILIPDDTQIDIEDQPFVFNAYTKPLSWVNQRWGSMFKDGAAIATVNTETELVDSARLNGGRIARDAKPDSCLVIEAWIKPGALRDLPKGGMLTIVNNDTIVQAVLDGFPYAHGEYPFAKYDSIPTGSYFSASVVESLIPLQRELNRNRSRRTDIANKAVQPGLMYDRGSMNPSKVTNRTGEMIEVMPGSRWPVPKPTPTIPPFMFQEEQEIITDIEDLSGQHQISKGSAPSGVTAATAIQYLSEQDNSYMSTVFDSIESAQEKIARQTVGLFIQYADVPRMIKVAGKNNAQSVKLLKGADLKGQTDITVEAGSSMPTSRAAYVAQVTDFMTRGLVDPQMGLKMLGLPGFSAYYDLMDLDENHALRENIKFEGADLNEVTAKRQESDSRKYMDMLNMVEQANAMAMDPSEIIQIDQSSQEAMMEQLDDLAANDPRFAQLAGEYDVSIWPINDFDNHDVHIEVHNRLRKSQTYENLPPEIQTEIDRHVNAHEEAKQMKTLQEQFLAGGQMPGEASDFLTDPETGGPVEGNEDQPVAEEADQQAQAGQDNQFSGNPPQDTAGQEQLA